MEGRLSITRRTTLALAAALLLSSGAKAEDCGTPVAGADAWPIAAPAEVGMSADALCVIGPRMAAWREAKIHSILIVRHGRLVFERYFSGVDERWGDALGEVTFRPDTQHDVRSITKSVTSLLLGIAIDRGWVPGIDAPAFSFLPEYADLKTPEKNAVTLRHLLTMSAGFAWDENAPYSSPGNSETAMNRSVDPYRYVLAQPIGTAPGTIYNYSGGSATLIAAILHKATGKTADQLARELLFDPLGIGPVSWIRYANGDPVVASGLAMKPRDLARLGQLVLNRGTWNGKQIVPAAWIDASIAPQIQGSQLYFYGYQWWVGRSLLAGHQVDWVAGVGLGGQRVFVVPSLDLVAVMTAGLYYSDMQDWAPLQIFNRRILAAVLMQ
jgi:CubicO group peptidase (beta-lactamase class C family)